VNRKADFFTKRIDSIRTTNRIESIRIANWNALLHTPTSPARLRTRSEGATYRHDYPAIHVHREPATGPYPLRRPCLSTLSSSVHCKITEQRFPISNSPVMWQLYTMSQKKLPTRKERKEKGKSGHINVRSEADYMSQTYSTARNRSDTDKSSIAAWELYLIACSSNPTKPLARTQDWTWAAQVASRLG